MPHRRARPRPGSEAGRSLTVSGPVNTRPFDQCRLGRMAWCGSRNMMHAVWCWSPLITGKDWAGFYNETDSPGRWRCENDQQHSAICRSSAQIFTQSILYSVLHNCIPANTMLCLKTGLFQMHHTSFGIIFPVHWFSLVLISLWRTCCFVRYIVYQLLFSHLHVNTPTLFLCRFETYLFNKPFPVQ